MRKNKLLSFYIKQQMRAAQVRKALQKKDGSVTGDMGIWVFIVACTGLLIVGLLVSYIRNEGFPALTDRLSEIANYS